jgi:hypothetical protein
MVWRTFIGQWGAGDFRLRQSKAGYDVMAALAPEQLALDSSWSDVGILVTKGLVNVPANPAPGYVQVDFGETLPNVPFVIVFRKIASNAMRQGSDRSTNLNYQPWFPTVGTSYLRFWQNRGDSGGNANAYTAGYIVLRSLF